MKEVTFWTIMSDTDMSQKFKEFLEKSHCEENLLFWIDAQQFLFTPADITKDTLNAQAHMLYKKYFESHSQHALNVDASHTKKIKNCLDSNVHRAMFSDVQRACLLLMEGDSIPKFKRTLK